MRELRQHASRYLAQVAQGETFEVTDRGRPVALLVPTGSDRWSDLIATGHVAAATDGSDPDEDPPADYGINASTRLADARRHER